MAVTALSRPGQNLGAGSVEANFIEKFSGEVLAFFEQNNVMLGRTTSKQLTGAKSFLFPAAWKATTTYHTAGQNVLEDGTYLDNIQTTRKEVFLDDELLSTTFVHDLDAVKNYWSEREHYARALGVALAEQADYNISATAFAASQAAETFTGSGAGTSLTIDTVANGGYDDAEIVGANVSKVVDEIFNMKAAFDNKNIPQEGRMCLIRPDTHVDMVRYANDYVAASAAREDFGSADKTRGTMQMIAGFELVVLPLGSLPAAGNAAVATGEKNDPFGAGNGYTTALWDRHIATCLHKTSVGSVRAADIALETERKMEYRGWPMIASYIMGHGILRPESAGAILTV